MQDKKISINPPHAKSDYARNDEGYPMYPDNEDIYNQSKNEHDVDPEDPTRRKETYSGENAFTANEKDFEEDESGDDLDVPGSELDDLEESIGNEDEENNYYSIGGDNHNDLEEDRD